MKRYPISIPIAATDSIEVPAYVQARKFVGVVADKVMTRFRTPNDKIRIGTTARMRLCI